MTTHTHLTTVEALKACEALNAFTRNALDNLKQGLPMIADEQDLELLEHATELLNNSRFKASKFISESNTAVSRAKCSGQLIPDTTLSLSSVGAGANQSLNW